MLKRYHHITIHSNKIKNLPTKLMLFNERRRKYLKKNGKMAEKKEKVYAYDAQIESIVKQQFLQPLSEMRK